MMDILINNNNNNNVNSSVNLRQNHIERLRNNPVGNKRLDANSNSNSFSSFVGQDIPGTMFQLDDMNMNGTKANGMNTNTTNSNTNSSANSNININMNMNCNNNYIVSSSTGSTAEDKNKILLKYLRRRSKNSLNFKEVVANFWMPPVAENVDQSGIPGVAASTNTNNNTIVTSSPLKDNQNANNLMRQRSSCEFSGMFHPIEIKSDCKSNVNANVNTNNSNANANSNSNIHPPYGSPNATMNLRANPINTEPTPMRMQIQRQTQSSSTNRSTDPLITPSFMFGIDKQLFQSPSMIVSNTNKNSTTLYRGSNTNSNTNSNANSDTLRTSSVSDLLTPNALPSAMVSASPKSNGVLHGNAYFPTSSILNCATSIVGCNNLKDLSSFYSHSNGRGISISDAIGNSMNMSVSEPVQPGPYDIVCGRNSGAYNYIGNRRFRVTIEMNLQRYIDSPTREDKTNVIKSIVRMLHNDVGARFLKKETIKPSKHVHTHAHHTKMQSQSSGKNAIVTARFTIMTGKQAREKVGHTLRDLVITERRERQQKQRWQ